MQKLAEIGIPAVVFFLAAGAVWLTGSRLISLFRLANTRLFRLLFTGLYVLALIGLIIGERSADNITGLSYWLAGLMWAFLLYLTLAFLAERLIRMFIKVPSAWSGSLALVVAASAVAYGIYAARSFYINETEISIVNLRQPLTIMHISDVHLGHHRGRNYLQKIVMASNARHPDLVVINGDLLDAAVALQRNVLEPLAGFDAPVYYTGGNHEKYINEQLSEALISSAGVSVLRNNIAIMHGIQLVGLRYMKADEETLDLHPSDEKDTIKSVVNKLKLYADLPAIFVHHSPVGVKYMSEKGADLVLSGHTHAGQFFPGTLLTPLFFAFNRGLSHYNNTQVLVSQGAGTYMAPLRLGSRNEINLIHLVPDI